MALPTELHEISTDSELQSVCDAVAEFARVLDPDIEFQSALQHSVFSHAQHGGSSLSGPDDELAARVASVHLSQDLSKMIVVEDPGLQASAGSGTVTPCKAGAAGEFKGVQRVQNATSTTNSLHPFHSSCHDARSLDACTA
jgi:hypothetical protein